ncbi:type 1 protein phosphatase-activating protein YPI1 [Spizellomyces punctatus DAOM BR117]|uniref:Type 1 phosphatases regulator n=1 Tax=Spizellomyces punctatus (strain DAOM BR117) TaxID=645134 RepID=A0A0L0H770_SPIPD|nr:type 1 protein phosphatase-activating protein YPI1 [Spizellomyces punctatus DAOM BR117]KNC97380.1 hypothetical protein SPPG_07307 [Spizellomyces punctatus DAOM BR117]|eukprot:XP_016605420.1 hypothetical protein SPPG_07307 [Spizellomyces punctatus DAOM BR117]
MPSPQTTHLAEPEPNSSLVTATAPLSTGSRTITVQEEQLLQQPSTQIPNAGTLLLRGGNLSERRVQWDENVVNNEGMGRKSSKVCCIYRKPHSIDESSDSESSSGSESDDDPSKPNAYEREPRSVRKRRQEKGKSRAHIHNASCAH